MAACPKHGAAETRFPKLLSALSGCQNIFRNPFFHQLHERSLLID
jgi:hypothetical protein